jgi:hypothetical protein
VPLAYAAYAGVAAHLPQGFNIVGQQQGFAAHAGGGKCRLGAGVTAADNNDIKDFWVVHHALEAAGRRRENDEAEPEKRKACILKERQNSHSDLMEFSRKTCLKCYKINSIRGVA